MLLSYKPLHLEAQQRLQEEGCVVDINVILKAQHGHTMTVSVKLDKDGHSYFNAELWRKMSKCYELKAGNKILCVHHSLV